MVPLRVRELGISKKPGIGVFTAEGAESFCVENFPSANLNDPAVRNKLERVKTELRSHLAFTKEEVEHVCGQDAGRRLKIPNDEMPTWEIYITSFLGRV